MIARHVSRALIALAVLAGAVLGCRAIIGVEERVLSDGGTDSDAGELSCANYCKLITETCTGEHQQYGSEAACLKLCPSFPLGTLDDDFKDTIGCRIREVKAIKDNTETQSCPKAGPGGAGRCGSNCAAYCTGLEDICPDQYDTFTADGGCEDKCGALIVDCGNYDADASRNDDTMQCRLFHLTSAATDSIEHCPHTIGLMGKCDQPISDAGVCDAGQ